eukprot:TRINITY_DN24949_c0_g1_i1.p1 TRINITY_DN24949_c0_g1~~TRINITY_DN24949_c0_g1_i1.p1  ORF type:complete len:194 (-),score=56.17 TRINITY_DN24949_c0_g1_i1:32-529(-)
MLRSLVGSEMCIRDRGWNPTRSTRSGYRRTQQETPQPGATRGGAPVGGRVDWEARAQWFYSNISSELEADQQVQQELQEAAEMQSGGLDRGGWWQMAEMMQAELAYQQEREKQAIDDPKNKSCLLYTSDAADEEDSVDLGGRRIIKKKKKERKKKRSYSTIQCTR